MVSAMKKSSHILTHCWSHCGSCGIQSILGSHSIGIEHAPSPEHRPSELCLVFDGGSELQKTILKTGSGKEICDVTLGGHQE